MNALRCVVVLFALALGIGSAAAQNNRGTLNYPQKITTGGTFQQIRPANSRWSIEVQNNQTGTDNCWIIPNGAGQIVSGTTTLSTSVTINGATVTAQQAAILLTPGGSWTRYYPYVPNDAIYGTCATSGDSLYVDEQ